MLRHQFCLQNNLAAHHGIKLLYQYNAIPRTKERIGYIHLFGYRRSSTQFHLRKADNIFARALICPRCTFFGVSASSFPPLSRAIPPLRSVVLVDASRRCATGDFEPALAGRSLIVSRGSSLGFRTRCLRIGVSLETLVWKPRGSRPSSQGVPVIYLTFLGRPGTVCGAVLETGGEEPPWVRQLDADTLVAVVDTLLILELL